MSWYTFRGNESSVHIIARPNPRVLNSVRIALLVPALTRSQKEFFFLLFFKSDYFLSCFAGMKAQASQVQLFKYSFCLSYRAAYTPTAALPTSDVAMFFSSLGLKPHPSFQKGNVQDTSREERLAPQWKTGLVTHKSGKRLIFLFIFSCESIKKPTSLCASVTRNYHPKSNKRQYEVAIIVQIFKICFLSLTSRLLNIFSSKTYLVFLTSKETK